MAEVFGVRREPGPLRTMLYEGGESSRIYEGEYRVVFDFDWPEGRPGQGETGEGDYLMCQRWLLLAAEAVPVLVSDPRDSSQHWVRVTSARIESA